MDPDPVTGTASKCAFCMESSVAKSYDVAPFLTHFVEAQALVVPDAVF